MLVYRISKKEYVKDLNGFGAGLFGGRWNPRGLNMVYTSGSISLASLEFLVHNYHILSSSDVALAEIQISDDDSLVKVVDEKELPHDWSEKSYTPLSTQEIGNEFLTSSAYILKVPSAIVPFENNYLLNPMHEAHRETKIRRVIDPFIFDKRLFDHQVSK